MRVAYFLGVAGVLCCGRNSAPLSPAASKASAGALEYLPIHACRSMPRTLSRAAEVGWHIVGEPLHFTLGCFCTTIAGHLHIASRLNGSSICSCTAS